MVHYLAENFVNLQANHYDKKMEKKLNRIKVMLVEKDISQTELAEKLGKSFSTINAYCANRQQPSLELLYEIADFLKVSIKDLIVDNETVKQ